MRKSIRPIETTRISEGDLVKIIDCPFFKHNNQFGIIKGISNTYLGTCFDVYLSLDNHIYPINSFYLRKATKGERFLFNIRKELIF